MDGRVEGELFHLGLGAPLRAGFFHLAVASDAYHMIKLGGRMPDHPAETQFQEYIASCIRTAARGYPRV